MALLGVIVLGLASRHWHGLFPSFLAKYPGDALWALMVFAGWGLVFLSQSTGRIALYSLGTSFLVEIFKFCHAPWIDGVRNTPLGHLVLGHTLSWGNLLAYTLGTTLGPHITYALAPLGEQLIDAEGLASKLYVHFA